MGSSIDDITDATPASGARTVVLIEDDVVIAKLTEYMLAREGYEVVVAHDGQTGLEAVFENRPRVALVDLTLPDTSGDEICRTIRSDARSSDTFLVVLTARDEMEARQRARNAGADAYACKPCDPDRMLEIVARGFAAPRTGLESRLEPSV